MKIGFKRCLLRLESSMHISLRFFWHKHWHGIHVCQFLDILKVLIDVKLASIHTSFVLLQL
jgi:hypothetical protein